MKRFHQMTMACLAVAGIVLGSAVVSADDENEGNQREERKERRVEFRFRAPSKYWIGVHTVPVDDALQSHLDISDRVMVANVVPDSPAAKAGLKKHDIILEFGEQEIASVADLFKAVGDNEAKETTVKIIRGGERMSIAIEAVERPESIAFAPQLDPDSIYRWFRAGDNNPNRFRVIGPGIATGFAAGLPGNLSIEVKKENDKPTKIVVKRGDDSWEVTEENLDELPEDLQPHVKRFLGHGGGMFGGPRRLLLRSGDDGAIFLGPDFRNPDGIVRGAPPQLEEALRRMEALQRRLSEEDPFKELRKEMESLRREVEKLRDKDSDPDSEADGGLEA